MTVYRRVRDLREDNDKTQSQIAQILNMQTTVYQRYERGERELPLWAAIKLADYYGVTLDYLVGREYFFLFSLLKPQKKDTQVSFFCLFITR